MQQIFSFGLGTGRFFMGSSEPLGHHCPEYIDTWDSCTIPVDDDYAQLPSPTTDASAATGGSDFPSKPFANPLLGEEDVSSMSIMTEVVKAVTVAITNDIPPNVNLGLYSTIMNATGFRA
jgi:hypothetical protein